ncbi:MAG: TlpA disulfide reductase family protein [Nitrospinae bacterium]|nr:TlpA disulfide reductase family protein [Nitrospinota bacterium]MDA1108349.1 TlpA disulfide reductase family protein [Nitrospinota bacterium]
MSKVNEKAPELVVDCWAQGKPSTIEKESGKVILIKFFQVNCPGCFIHGFPEIIDIYNKYQDQALALWGLATAFEDFDKNNLENLKKLLTNGEVIGETLAAMAQANLLNYNRLQYSIPFPVAWDKLEKNPPEISPDRIQKIIHRDIENFDSLPDKTQTLIVSQVKAYLKQKKYDAHTFEAYGLRGTPSTILIDKRGILRHKLFGSEQGLEESLKILLNE